LKIEAGIRLDDEISHFFNVLGHPLRRQVIKVLGEKSSVSFTDLKSTLNVSVGTLYYNLDLLKGIVEQNANKKYVLTNKGKLAYRLLVESEEKLLSLGLKSQKQLTWLKPLISVLMMRRFFACIYSSIIVSLPSAITILIYGMWITKEAQLFPIIVVYSDQPSMPPLWYACLFLIGWVIINILGNIVPLIFYRTPMETASYLLVGSCYALLPSLAFPTLWAICKTFLIPLSSLATQLIMLLSAGYSLCLLTSAISMAKGLRTEKASLVTIIMLYIIIGIAFFL
jgi:DNA-binding transcriptional ArsR family regulator